MKTTDNKTAFAELLTAYSTAYASKTADPDTFTDALTDLAGAVAFSVLKKCIESTLKAPTYNGALMDVRRDLAMAKNALASLKWAGESAYTGRINSNGNYVSEALDGHAIGVLNTLSMQVLGDGIDLMQEAIVAILEETKKCIDRSPDRLIDLEAPYFIRRLNRKVWIKLEDSVGGWEEVETAPITEVHKAVRRAIDANRAASVDPKNGFTYLSDLARDPETAEETVIYRRLPKYANLGGYATDIGGHIDYTSTYTTDISTVDEYDRIIELLQLTVKQSKILTLRMSGYGNKAVATYLGITENSVKGAMNEIRRKAKKAGFTPISVPSVDPIDTDRPDPNYYDLMDD